MNTELQIEQPLIAGHELGCKCFQCGQEWLKANYEKEVRSTATERTILSRWSLDLDIPYIKDESQEDYLKRYNEMLRQRLVETFKAMIWAVENEKDLKNINQLALSLERCNLNCRFGIHLIEGERNE